MSLRSDCTARELCALGVLKLEQTRRELCSLEALIKTIPSRRKRQRAQQTLDRVVESIRNAELFFPRLCPAQRANHPWGSIVSEVRDYALDYGNADIALHVLMCERDLHGASIGTASSILVRVLRELGTDQSESLETFLTSFGDNPSADSTLGYAEGWMRRCEIGLAVAWSLHDRATVAKAAESAAKVPVTQ